MNEESAELVFRCVDYQYMEIVEKMVFMVMSLSVTFSREQIIELIREKFQSSFSVFANQELTDFFSFDIHYYNVQEGGSHAGSRKFTGQYNPIHISELIGKIVIFINLIYQQTPFHQLHYHIQETVYIFRGFEELEIKSVDQVYPDGSLVFTGVPVVVGSTVGYGQKLSQLFLHYIEQLFLSRSDIDFFTSHTRPFFSLDLPNIDVLDERICKVLNPLNGESGIPGYRARIRPIVSRITIHWPSFYNVVTGKTLALPNLIALQHIPLSPAGVIAKRPAPIALPNSCAAEWRMAPDAVFSPYASVRYFTPHMVHSQYNLL